MSYVRAFILGATAFALGTALPAGAQTQGPIHVLFDMHVDPWPNTLPLAQKQVVSQAWIANMNWVLDQTEPLGVKISFLSGGPWTELVVAGGASGPGAVLLRRIYQSGAQIGSHNHRELRAGANNWPDLPAGATLAQIQQAWQDNISWVNSAILTAFSGAPPEALSLINSVRGTHLPANEPDYHALMQLFAIPVREGGAEEDYYQWYGHHIWQPFRPSAANYMDEDLGASFVVCPQGSVIGLAQVHHGVFQDMTAPQVKRQFLQLYLNWRHRDRQALPEKVWCWGWGSHASDFDPSDPSRPAIQDVLPWIDQHFARRVEPGGSQAMVWDTQRNTAAVYRAWEAAHPGESSWNFDALAVDWNEYPYLRPVAEELAGFGWSADLILGAGVDAFALQNGAVRAVLLWRAAGTSTVDVSAWVGPAVRVVGLESGAHFAAVASAVSVGQEPLLVTERSACPAPVSICIGAPNSVGAGARMSCSGSTSIAADDFVLLTSGLPPGTNGLFFLGALPAQTPFGDGFRCVAGSVLRLPVQQATPQGTASRALHYAALPPPVAIVPGSVRNFQFWYRNPAGPGGTGFNLSDALNAHFCP